MSQINWPSAGLAPESDISQGDQGTPAPQAPQAPSNPPQAINWPTAGVTPAAAPSQPSFMDRLGVTGLVNSAKQDYQALQAKRQARFDTGTTVTDLVKKGDFGSAAEVLLQHLYSATPVLPGLIGTAVGTAQDAYSNLKAVAVPTPEQSKEELGTRVARAVPIIGPMVTDASKAAFEDRGGRPFKFDPVQNPAGLAGDLTNLTAKIAPLAIGSANAAAPEIDEAANAASVADKAVEAEPSSSFGTPATPATPKEAYVSKIVGKSKLSTGTPDLPSPAESGEDFFQDVHQNDIRNSVNTKLKSDGLKSIPETVSVRDVPNEMSKQYELRSKATFDSVEKITGVNLTTLKEIMASRADQIEEATAADDLEKANNLQQLQYKDEYRSDKAFSQAKLQNVDVEQARSDWNKSLRAKEFSSAVRISSEGTLEDPILNLKKLTPRLQKLSDNIGTRPGKLTQLFGKDNASDLVSKAEGWRGMSEDISKEGPISATGKQALTKLISSNTSPSTLPFGQTTSYWKALKAFDDLGASGQETQFGEEAGTARQFLQRQFAKQLGERIAAGVGITAIAKELGISSYLLHTLIE